MEDIGNYVNLLMQKIVAYLPNIIGAILAVIHWTLVD